MSSVQSLQKVTNVQRIDTLLIEYKDAPKQGTAEWLKQRTGIGGSEIAIITGDSSFSKIKDLIGRHVGLSTFTGNKFTHWGRVFEDQIKNIVELIMDCKIHETGSIQGCIPNHRYSPDGLTTMKLLVGTEWKYKNNVDMYNILTNIVQPTDDPLLRLAISYMYYNVLMEFKCPYSRIPSGKIPKEYAPQVKSGLCDLDCCDIALFVNAAFRICSYKDWVDNDVYNTAYHSFDASVAKQKIIQKEFSTPLVMGGMGVYIHINDIIEDVVVPEVGTHEYENFHWKNQTRNTIVDRGPYGEETLLDFGNCEHYLFNRLLELGSNDEVSLYYMKPQVYPKIKNVEFLNVQQRDVEFKSMSRFKRSERVSEFKQWCYDHDCKPLGFIPWKLFKCDFLVQNREVDFLEKCSDKIEEVMGHIRTIQLVENMDERQEMIDQLDIKSVGEESGRIKKRKPRKPKIVQLPVNVPTRMVDEMFDLA